jgi:hypothetical protein
MCVRQALYKKRILEEASWKAEYLNKSAQGKQKMLLLACR